MNTHGLKSGELQESTVPMSNAYLNDAELERSLHSLEEWRANVLGRVDAWMDQSQHGIQSSCLGTYFLSAEENPLTPMPAVEQQRMLFDAQALPGPVEHDYPLVSIAVIQASSGGCISEAAVADTQEPETLAEDEALNAGCLGSLFFQ